MENETQIFAANYHDILLSENRCVDKMNEIYLYKEKANDDWYVAYEWSAYLLEFYYDFVGQNRLQAQKRMINSQEIIKVSLKPSSFDKYIPKPLEKRFLNENDNRIFVIKVDLSKYNNEHKAKFGNDLNIMSYNNVLNDWKSKYKVNLKNNSINQTIQNKNTVLSIISKISKYQTYGKSDSDIANFFIEVQKNCYNILC